MCDLIWALKGAYMNSDLSKLISTTSNARLRLRLLAVSHFIDGKNRTEIASFLKVSRLSVNKWIKTYLDYGIEALTEKPKSSVFVNSGLYVMNRRSLKKIPDNKFFDITDLINLINSDGGKIGAFPVSEKAWVDIGNWDEYLKSFGK